jgi:hypothetical protein
MTHLSTMSGNTLRSIVRRVTPSGAASCCSAIQITGAA